MAADPPFEVFGDKARFALEIRQTSAAVIGTEPEDSAGSWGEWRLSIANLNLCELRLDTQNGLTQVHEVRWFLAPFFAWIVENWMPLLHEKRLPPGGRLGDSRPRSARAAYLAMVESAGMTSNDFALGSAGPTGIRCAPPPMEEFCPTCLFSAWTMTWSFPGVIGCNREPMQRALLSRTGWQGLPWTQLQSPCSQRCGGSFYDNNRTKRHGCMSCERVGRRYVASLPGLPLCPGFSIPAPSRKR